MNELNQNTGLNGNTGVSPTSANTAVSGGADPITALLNNAAPIMEQQSNWMETISFGKIKSNATKRDDAQKALQDGQRAIQDAQNAAQINLAQLGNVGKQIQADAQRYGWDAQKIIQQLQLEGLIDTNKANKAIAKAQQYAATYAAVANTTASKATVANTKIAQDAANKRVIYWLGGIAVLGILAFIGFVFYKTKIKD